MSERNITRFLLIAAATLLAMTGLAELVPNVLGIHGAYGIVISAMGLSVVLFSWHVWVQTSPGGIHLEAYQAKPAKERLIDFLVVIGASGGFGLLGAIVGIEGGSIEPDIMWEGGTTSFIATTIVIIIGMAAGILAGLRRNSDIRISREDGRGE